jgi:HPt (histidine-containing phosphotransfer) domain-containing protein
MIRLNKQITQFAKAAAGDFGAAGSEADYAYLKPTLDVADGLSRVMNNKKLHLRLLSKFSGPRMAEDIIAAIQEGDHAKVQQTAHALKGVSANLGLSDLMSISLQIEIRAKAAEAAKDLLPALKQEVAAAMSAIECLLAGEEA